MYVFRQVWTIKEAKSELSERSCVAVFVLASSSIDVLTVETWSGDIAQAFRRQQDVKEINLRQERRHIEQELRDEVGECHREGADRRIVNSGWHQECTPKFVIAAFVVVSEPWNLGNP
jgi:hypothetical protein